MANVVSQINALSAGELSPSLYGRQDLEKWRSGTSTCRNFFVNYRGGVISRAGLAYVGTCKQPGTASPPRDIPFQFNIYQGYVLEFGDFYMRIKFNGAYVTEAPITVTSVNTSALFTTSTTHGLSVGDWVYDQGNADFNGLTWIVSSVPTTSTFTVTDLFGNVITAATASTGGTVSRLYTVNSPYAAEDLPYLKYTQSADTMTLTCVNTDTPTEYPSYELVRMNNTDWVFTADSFSSTIVAPTGLVATAQSSTLLSTWYAYVVTAVDSATGEESNASLPVSVQNNDIAINAGSNTLAWASVPTAASYNVYAATPSYSITTPISALYGFIGSALGPQFTDTNITPDFSIVPPVHNDPFAVGAIEDITPLTLGSSYSQGTVGYTITTSTGSGFAGVPIISNSEFIGFLIYNKGKNFRSTDTITLTDSGGGTATGYWNFTANPTNKAVITVNGQQIEFVDGTAGLSNQQTTIGSTTLITLQALCNVLNTSAILSWSVASYTTDGVKVYVTYKTPGAAGNAFTLDAGTTIGCTTSGAHLTGGGIAGTGATGSLVVGPLSGTYPSVAAYFQQRRVYASSLNDPDTYWMSQPGLFNNMDSSIPVTDADSITGAPWAQQVNGIQFLVPMPGGLVILTGKGAWQLNGGSTLAVTPSDQNAVPQAYNGCHNHVQPIVVNYDILYVQAKGSIVRDLSYNFFTNIYTGTDMTVLSNHLFINNQVLQWAYAEEPYKLVWVIRDDGSLLCLTYLKEQDVYAWTRHDTNGLFVSVVSITESQNPQLVTNVPPLIDAVYVITKRYVQGAWRYYSERMDNRLWVNVEDSFCVDSGLQSPITYPNATLTPTSATGTSVTFTASSGVFNSGMVGNIIRVGGGTAAITSYISSTSVICSITNAITNTVPDDPNNLPIPADAGNWTISVPVTTVSGLNHLEGLTVAVLADGSVIPNQVVLNGTITLPYPASYVVIGLPYICQVQTLYADHPTATGNTEQNRRKNISAIGLRVEASRGLTVGADQPDQSTHQNYPTIPWTNMNEIKERSNEVFAGSSIPLYTGDYYKAITSSWDLKGQVAIQQTYPLPASILSIVLYYLSGDDK